MSTQGYLPPRCPSRYIGVHPGAPNSIAQTQKDDRLSKEQGGFAFSCGSVLDEQPPWFDDLLTDLESRPKELSLRRSASDPVTLLDMSTSFYGSIYPIKEEEDESEGQLDNKLEPNGEENKNSYGFEADSCIYGPNSPRQKTKLTESESSMVSAVLENVPSNPLQYLSLELTNTSRISQTKDKGGDYRVEGDSDPEKLTKRRGGQRSRVRKLQYIAELERTVDMLQMAAADLAGRVATMFQQRVALSMENKNLRKEISSLQQEKILKDSEYQSLKSEAENLKMVVVRHHRRSKSAASCIEPGSSPADPSPLNWQMLDMGKLSLGSSPVQLRQSFRH